MLQLVDDDSQYRAVATSEETEGDGEQYQKRHATRQRQSPEEERGQSGVDSGYKSYSRGRKGEALVVA